MPKRGKNPKRSEYLMQVIELCRMIERRGVDPFNVEIPDLLERMRQQFPDLKLPDELCLDAEALRDVASVIGLQGDWVKHLSSSLYVDSVLVGFKVRALSVRLLAHSLLKSWRPIVSMEQISKDELRSAVDYWNNLLPLHERFKVLRSQEVPTGSVDLDSLIRSRILSNKSFEELIGDLWRELLAKAGEDGAVSYWDLVRAESYEDTILRAYLTSFLISYGYSRVKVDPLKDEVLLLPNREPTPLSRDGGILSLPIPIGREFWRSQKR